MGRHFCLRFTGADANLARRFPWQGEAFIAELVIPIENFRLEKTRGPGHYTLWGDPRAILACVRHVERA